MKIRDLCVSFGEKQVLNHFTAEFGPGITLLKAPSGYGKTTLLHTIAGLIVPDSGEITEKPEKISLMFQEDRLFPWLTALQNIKAVCDEEALSRRLLEAVELSKEEKSKPASLSGGMRRRISFARALAYQGDLLLLDEPFKGMDMALIKRLAPLLQNLTIPVILSTHSPEEQEVIGGRILEMDKLC